MEYKIISRSTISELNQDTNELAIVGWRVVSCWSAAVPGSITHYCCLSKEAATKETKKKKVLKEHA